MPEKILSPKEVAKALHEAQQCSKMNDGPVLRSAQKRQFSLAQIAFFVAIQLSI